MTDASAVSPGARSIAAPLAATLEARPMYAKVVTITAKAVIALDDDGRMLCLVSPETGDGPCSIVLDRPPAAGWLAALCPGTPLVADRRQLKMAVGRVGSKTRGVIDLARISCWQPTSFRLRRLRQDAATRMGILATLAQWPPVSQPAGCGSGSIAREIVRALEAAAERFDQATGSGHGMRAAAEGLVGLGPGLTPAGDDYLLGAMAAHWLLGTAACAALAAVLACPRLRAVTTAPSAAWLAAASQGDFGVHWHRLADALDAEDRTATRGALALLAARGATSGRASLAGFGRTVAGSWDRLGIDALSGDETSRTHLASSGRRRPEAGAFWNQAKPRPRRYEAQ